MFLNTQHKLVYIFLFMIRDLVDILNPCTLVSFLIQFFLDNPLFSGQIDLISSRK